MNWKIVFTIFIFQLLILGCLKEKKYEFSGIKSIQNNNSICLQNANLEGCLKNFPEIKGPFQNEEKTKATLILSNYFCLSRQKDLGTDLKNIVINRFIEEDIDLELINSYEVIKKADKISYLLDNSCNVEMFKNNNLFNKIKSSI